MSLLCGGRGALQSAPALTVNRRTLVLGNKRLQGQHACSSASLQASGIANNKTLPAPAHCGASRPASYSSKQWERPAQQSAARASRLRSRRMTAAVAPAAGLVQQGAAPPAQVQASPNGSAGRSRSGLLVAQQMLADKLAEDGKDVYDEYERLRRSPPRGTFHAALSSANEGRNRYSNVLPFDANRVRLQESQRSDYINASLLESPAGAAPAWRYIAAQGPKSGTVADFLQMVYEQQSAVIVMLTRTIEGVSIRKCADYFPEKVGGSATYGGWRVTCDSVQDVDSDVRRRDLTLTPPPGQGAPRSVAHFHYHAWPDHGVPAASRPLRDLIGSVQQLQRAAPSAGPTVVHCSAGIGRTGTFCAVDIALARMQTGDYGAAVSAAELRPLVAELRRQRMGMVQTAEQYCFCYQAIKDEVDEMLCAPSPASARHQVLSQASS